MINWIRNKLQTFVFKNLIINEEININNVEEDNSVNLPDPLEFKVQTAQGGTIVEVSSWDRKKDEPVVKLHIIPEGEDIADAIGKIVLMEMLRK
jgi:hypothetical protein